MLVKMSPRATEEQVDTIETKLHELGFKTGKMVGDEITLIGVYGDITQLPVGELRVRIPYGHGVIGAGPIAVGIRYVDLAVDKLDERSRVIHDRGSVAVGRSGEVVSKSQSVTDLVGRQLSDPCQSHLDRVVRRP